MLNINYLNNIITLYKINSNILKNSTQNVNKDLSESFPIIYKYEMFLTMYKKTGNLIHSTESSDLDFSF